MKSWYKQFAPDPGDRGGQQHPDRPAEEPGMPPKHPEEDAGTRPQTSEPDADKPPLGDNALEFSDKHDQGELIPIVRGEETQPGGDKEEEEKDRDKEERDREEKEKEEMDREDEKSERGRDSATPGDEFSSPETNAAAHDEDPVRGRKTDPVNESELQEEDLYK